MGSGVVNVCHPGGQMLEEEEKEAYEHMGLYNAM